MIPTLMYKHKQRSKANHMANPWQVNTAPFLSIKCTLHSAVRLGRQKDKSKKGGCLCVCVYTRREREGELRCMCVFSLIPGATVN